MILGRNGFVSVGDISNASVDPSMQRPANFPPTKPVFPFPVAPPLRKVDQQQQSKGTSPGANPSGTGGIPFVLLSLSAVQSPVKEQTQVASLITVSWTQQADPNFDHVNIWIVGYHGSSNPQLVASGSTAPVNFTLDATGETISLYAQTTSSSGEAAPILFAAHTTVTLSGAVTNPPAPIIVQTLIGIPIGYQFSFEQIDLPSNDEEVISAYRVYKSSTNSFSTATLNQTLVQDPTATGAIVVQDNVGGGKTFYYWVTSVNSTGLESLPTNAQTGAVVSGPVDPSTGDVATKGSLPPSYSGSFTYTSTTSSITWKWSGMTIYNADGTVTSIPDGSQTVTGLTVATTYTFFPVYNLSTATLKWIASSDLTQPLTSVTGVTLTQGTPSGYITTATSLTRPTSVSVECWFHINNSGQFDLFRFAAPQTGITFTSTDFLLSVSEASAGEVIWLPGSGSVSSTSTYDDGNWHHVAATYNGTTAILYVDGVQVATGSVTAIGSFSGWWRLGTDLNTGTIGTIAHCAVYSGVVLTATQVANHFNTMSASGVSSYENLVAVDGATAYWRLQETSGSVAADSIGTNTGTYQNVGQISYSQSSQIESSQGTPPIAWAGTIIQTVQAQTLQGNVPLSGDSLTAATTSGGTGGGSGGGAQGSGGGGNKRFTA